jgi:ParB-like chromosome segregation protein Spo0J
MPRRKPSTEPWRNRIVRHAEIDPQQLLANPKNWRIHPAAQQDALSAVIDDVGFVDEVTVQDGSDVVIDGHLRVALALQSGQATIPVAYTDLDDDEADVILATLDPIGAMAATDNALLGQLLGGIEREDRDVQNVLSGIAEREGITDDDEDKYTTKIETPIYTPTGDEPAISDLTDTTRRDELAAAIAAADIPDDVRAFLLSAAERHVVFDYRNIAEYYAHADADVQRLMEDSALVIIDVNRAIELGYAKLRDDLLDLVESAKRENG